jgi:hypothetical protein
MKICQRTEKIHTQVNLVAVTVRTSVPEDLIQSEEPVD